MRWAHARFGIGAKFVICDRVDVQKTDQCRRYKLPMAVKAKPPPPASCDDACEDPSAESDRKRQRDDGYFVQAPGGYSGRDRTCVEQTVYALTSPKMMVTIIDYRSLSRVKRTRWVCSPSEAGIA